MRVSIGNDHRGLDAKYKLVSLLEQLGHQVHDEGTRASESCDYPDYAAAVARHVTAGDADRGILICGTGIGMAITANKFSGIRAATCHDEITAEMCRKHNNVNVLCLSSDLLSDEAIARIVKTWLETEFEGGRHARRVDKITAIERDNGSCSETR